MAKRCQKCRDYRDCPGKPWYHYGEIRFCIYQILWVIEHSLTLIAGNWPADPDGSSYTDLNIRAGYKSEAYFAKPVEILAEVNYRLKRAGVDGKLLKAQVEGGKVIDELEPEARSALMYCKGKWRKRMSYQNWRKQRDYRDGK